MENRSRPLVVTFGAWKLLGTLILGCTIDRLITPWEGADVLRRSDDLLRGFHNWDALHYLRIARQSYVEPEDRVFYPLFPLLIRAGTTVIGDPVVAGLIVTAACSILWACVYHRFAARLVGARAAPVAIVFVIAMPAALFLNSIYAEALFLALLYLFFWFFFAESAWAGVVGALLALTRGQGIFVGFAVALILAGEAPGLWRDGRWSRAAYLVGVGTCFVAGLLAFMAYDYVQFGNPVEFMTVQATVYGYISGFSLANSFRPGHVLALLTTFPYDLNGPTHGSIDLLCMYASIAFAPLVWRLDRRLFAFYFCLAYFPATMGQGGSYFRYFLLPYSIAALALARAYVDRPTVRGIATGRVATVAIGAGFAIQAAFSLLQAAHRWVG